MTEARIGLPPKVAIDRRVVLKGAAWSAPVIAAATAAPMVAASGPIDPCVPVSAGFTSAVTSTDGATITLSASSPTVPGETYSIRITSALSANTVTKNGPTDPEETQVSHNLTVGNSGINGGRNNDVIFTGFGPLEAVVLNQRGQDPSNPAHSPVQTLTFEFFDGDGNIVNPESASVDVFDISSVLSSSGTARATYWDTVGFSLTPATIEAISALSQGSPGAGDGTLANPYRRLDGHQPSQEASQYHERFHFGSFPSGSTLQYTSHAGRAGWQFISITGIRFSVHAGC